MHHLNLCMTEYSRKGKCQPDKKKRRFFRKNGVSYQRCNCPSKPLPLRRQKYKFSMVTFVRFYAKIRSRGVEIYGKRSIVPSLNKER